MAPPLISARRRVKDHEVIGSGVYNLLIKKKNVVFGTQSWLVG